jgi:hypothetical protein
VHEWSKPRPDRAEFDAVRITTTDGGMLRSVESENEFRLLCQYGEASQITLNPPAWPAGKETVVDQQNFGVAMISKFIPAMMELALQK